MMSEAALSLMKGRMLEGMRHQARRGALLNPPPLGDVRGPDGDSHLDPDEQAQRVIRLIFETFEERLIFETFEEHGSLQGVLRSLVAHALRLPMRPHSGLNRGHLAWRRPPRMT